MIVNTINACLNVLFFFFTVAATTAIYTLSLHDALPILSCLPAPPRPRRADPSLVPGGGQPRAVRRWPRRRARAHDGDRKSTRLNSSHVEISYAVFCLKKKKKSFGVQ